MKTETATLSARARWNRFASRSRLQRKRMFARLCFGRIAEWRGNRFALVPIGKLVRIVLAPELPRFPGGKQKDGLIPIGKIGHKAHRGSMVSCRGAHAEPRARLGLLCDAEEPPQKAVSRDG